MISNSNFILKDIPNYNPWVQRLEHDEFWREQKRRCIEGYWSGGKWMPPELYYYSNFHTIEVMSGIIKKLDRPFLRDIDWEKAYIWTEATGFSGFELDTIYTCDRRYGPEKESAIKYRRITEEEANSKIYVPARDYLKRIFPTSMGKPLYRNEGKNIIDLESRGCLLKGTSILMFDGSNKSVEDLIIGDELMGKDGTKRLVLDLHNGVDKMFIVRHCTGYFKDLICNSNHILSVLDSDFKETSIPIKDVIELLNNEQKLWRYIPQKFGFNFSEFIIDEYGEGEYYGLIVDKDHEYLLSDFSVDHNTGKTYWATGCCAHNFLFDGARDFDEYIQLKKEKKRMTSQGIVGAVDAKYTNDFMRKVVLSIANLPGEYSISSGRGDLYAAPPFQVEWTGSPAVGKEMKSKGGSVIYPYSFADNPLAAAGKRPNRAWLDEVGFLSSLIETKEAIETSQTSESFKRLTIHMMGTGGLTSGGAVMYAYDMFYNPEAYNCLSFEDLYEGKGKIGYFVPATKGLNEFKFGPDYISDEKLALECIMDEREKSKAGGKKKELATIINKPIYPSEIFLQKDGGVFPLEDLKAQIAFVEQSLVKYDTSLKYELTYRDGRLTPVVSMKSPIRQFPLKDNKEMDACIEIWELPKRDDLGNVYSNRYIAGWDVVDADGNEDNKLSLQSLFIMDAISGEIVAEYTARTYLADQFYEQARRLLILYNAIVNYEQNKKGPYTHFKNKNSLYLMCKTPEILRATGLSKTKNSTGNNMLGTHSNAETNALGIELIQKWLEEPAYHNNPEGTLRNIDTIKSLGLLRELFMWNKDINADRVSALIMLLILKTDRTRITESMSQNNIKDKSSDSFWDKAWKGKLRR